MANETVIEVFFKKVAKCFSFYLGSVVNRAEWWILAFFNVDVMVELRTVLRQLVGLGLAKDVKIVVIFGGDS